MRTGLNEADATAVADALVLAERDVREGTAVLIRSSYLDLQPDRVRPERVGALLAYMKTL